MENPHADLRRGTGAPSVPAARGLGVQSADTASAQKRPDLRAYWGKAGYKKATDTIPHPLVCHAIDTAMVADLLYDRLLGPRCRAELTEALAPLGADARSWVALLAGLHDLGKLSVAFQALRADVAELFLTGLARDSVTRLAENRRSLRAGNLHGTLTAHHIRRLLESWGAPKKTAQALGQALGGHHGIYLSADEIKAAKVAIGDHGGEPWAAQVDEFVRLVARLIELPDPQAQPWSMVHLGTGATVALAGLTTVSDWIASGSVDALHEGVDVDLEEYVDRSRRRASEHVTGKLRWLPWTPPVDTSYRRLFEVEPNPLQQAIVKLLATKTAPGILVIDAPTGEGKTYAALHACLDLVRRLGLAGLYYAMPTRATANQVFEETDAMLGRLEADVRPQLLHGTAAQYLADRRAPAERAEALVPTGVGIDEPGGDQDTAARVWFTRNRELLCAWAIGTIDRLLRAGIRARWAPVPLAAVSNRVIVLDEIHAYDLYMSTILDRLLWWLGWLEVPVILLSATLPRARRDQLIRAWYAGARHCQLDEVTLPLPSTPYPGALWLDRAGVPDVTDPVDASPRNRNRRVRLERVSDEDLVGWALERASRGWGVAIIHNLVRRVDVTDASLAEAIARLPADQRPHLVKLTRQLTRTTRIAVEAELRQRFGRDGTRAPQSGYIVVGTQILEQSLDLDFDAMATDLAPIDGMIQRAGRLHRFRLPDPNTPPELFIVGVTTRGDEPRWPPYTVNIYDDAVLLRTWALLRNRPELRLPDDAPTLINIVYGAPPECPGGWERRWARAESKLQHEREVDAYLARRLFLPPPTTANALRELTKHPKPQFQTRKPSQRGTRHA